MEKLSSHKWWKNFSVKSQSERCGSKYYSKKFLLKTHCVKKYMNTAKTYCLSSFGECLPRHNQVSIVMLSQVGSLKQWIWDLLVHTLHQTFALPTKEIYSGKHLILVVVNLQAFCFHFPRAEIEIWQHFNILVRITSGISTVFYLTLLWEHPGKSGWLQWGLVSWFFLTQVVGRVYLHSSVKCISVVCQAKTWNFVVSHSFLE